MFLYFGTIDVHSNQKFNFTVKLESLEKAALTAAQVHHLRRRTNYERKLILAGESTTTCVKVKVITAKKTLRRTFGVNLPLVLRRYLALIGISVTCFGEDVN